MDGFAICGRVAEQVIDPLLPEPLGLASCRVQVTTERITILTRTASLTAACPAGGTSPVASRLKYTK
jgi:hypothetical protein